MKLFLSFLLLSFSSSLFAIQWEIVGPKILRGELPVDLGKSVGEITIQILDQNKIPYVGNESGINSILNTPIGDEALEILSDDSMKAYGWCFEVDGLQPDVMPDKAYFPKQTSRLRWFFAYALYDKGEWKSYCNPLKY